MMKRILKIVAFTILLYSFQMITLESASNKRELNNAHENMDNLSFQLYSSNNDPLNEGEKIVSGKKTVSYKNGKGDLLWSIIVEGTFKYGNGSATCIESKIIVNCKDKNWNISNYYSTKTENSAIVSAVGKRYLFAIPVQSINKSVELHCSNDGTLY